ncbi:hypothetical protein HYU45_02500 [Candidatus Daviesbacteria bacterium]|nr:hypothetical protein [Candidatus Daviesbacteria bacterium]
MKLLSKIATLLLLLATFFLAGTELIYAQNTQDLKLPNTIINPGSFYYPFKRLIEKGRERVIFSAEGKISFAASLLKTRLSELDYVTEKKVLSEIQGSSERFAYQAGILTEELIQSKSEKKKAIVKEFEKYSKFLEPLRDRYPANSSFWMLVQHDINTLSILGERLR